MKRRIKYFSLALICTLLAMVIVSTVLPLKLEAKAVTIGILFAVLVGTIVGIVHSATVLVVEKRWARKVEEMARKWKMEFLPEDREKLHRCYPWSRLFDGGFSRRCFNLLRSREKIAGREGKFTLFDYHTLQVKWDSNLECVRFYYSVALAEVPFDFPPTLIIPRDSTDTRKRLPPGGSLPWKGVFGKKFYVFAEDPDFVRHLINPRLRDFLCKVKRAPLIELGPETILIYYDRGTSFWGSQRDKDHLLATREVSLVILDRIEASACQEYLIPGARP